MGTKFFGNLKLGVTSVSVDMLLLKTADGTPDTGKVAAGLAAYFHPALAATTAVTLTDLLALTTGWTSGGVKEVADGLYRVDWPNAAFAVGDSVTLVLKDGTTAVAMERFSLEGHGPDDVYAALPAAPDNATIAQIHADTGNLLSGQTTINNSVQAINTAAALLRLIVPGQLPVPASGSTAFEFDLWLYDVEGHNENADGASNGVGSITFAVRNAAGASHSGQLGSVTWVSLGGYKVSYTVASTDASEELVVTASAVVGGSTRTISVQTLTAPFFATTFTTTDRGVLSGIAADYQQRGSAVTLPTNPPTDWLNGAAVKADAVTKIQAGLSTFAGGTVAGVTAPVTVGTNNDKAGYSLAASGLDAVPVETGVNARQALSPILAASAGVLSGAGTGTIVIKGGNVATTRITATTTSEGNRTGVTLSLPA